MTGFLAWECESKDTIDFKKLYVDMAGDILAGLLLSQIVFWNLPDKNGKNKLRVRREEHYWLAKSRGDWWDEVRLRPREVDAAIKRLREAGIIETRVWKFGGNPTTHIRVIPTGFMDTLRAVAKNERERSRTSCVRNGRRGTKKTEDFAGNALEETTQEDVPDPNSRICNNDGDEQSSHKSEISLSRIRNNQDITDSRIPPHESGTSSTETSSEKKLRKNQRNLAALASEADTALPAAPSEKPVKPRGPEYWETQDTKFAQDYCHTKGWHWRGHLPEEQKTPVAEQPKE
jgi:hypothetical protein